MSATLSELRHVLDDVELEGVPRASASAPIFVSRRRELPVLRHLDPDDLLAVAAAAAMSFKVRSRGPGAVGLPTLVATSSRWAEALVPYLSEALDRAGAPAD